jgi:hypothetical protein
MSKCFNFTINRSCIGKGYVYAETKEDAIAKIKDGSYLDCGDIYDEIGQKDGEIIEIEDGYEDEEGY